MWTRFTLVENSGTIWESSCTVLCPMENTSWPRLWAVPIWFTAPWISELLSSPTFFIVYTCTRAHLNDLKILWVSLPISLHFTGQLGQMTFSEMGESTEICAGVPLLFKATDKVDLIFLEGLSFTAAPGTFLAPTRVDHSLLLSHPASLTKTAPSLSPLV